MELNTYDLLILKTIIENELSESPKTFLTFDELKWGLRKVDDIEHDKITTDSLEKLRNINFLEFIGINEVKSGGGGYVYSDTGYKISR